VIWAIVTMVFFGPVFGVDSLHLRLYYSSTSGRLILIYVLADA
jgi:predicted membrane protein